MHRIFKTNIYFLRGKNKKKKCPTVFIYVGSRRQDDRKKPNNMATPPFCIPMHCPQRPSLRPINQSGIDTEQIAHVLLTNDQPGSIMKNAGTVCQSIYFRIRSLRHFNNIAHYRTYSQKMFIEGLNNHQLKCSLSL